MKFVNFLSLSNFESTFGNLHKRRGGGRGRGRGERGGVYRMKLPAIFIQ